MKRNKSLGFTLIELLIVIAIIGILSAVVLASLSSARKKAKAAKLASDLKSLQTAIIMHKDDNGGRLESTSDFYADDVGGNGFLDSNLEPILVAGGYIPEIPHFSGWPSDTSVYVRVIERFSADYGYFCIPDGSGSTKGAPDFLAEGYTGLIMAGSSDPDIVLPFDSHYYAYCYADDCANWSSSNQYCLPF